MARKLILVTGPPSSGKSTLATNISEAMGFPVISTGNLARSLATGKSADSLDKGELFSAEHLLLNQLKNEIDACTSEAVIVDGLPRRGSQLAWAVHNYDVFLIMLDYDYEATLIRAHGRKDQKQEWVYKVHTHRYHIWCKHYEEIKYTAEHVLHTLTKMYWINLPENLNGHLVLETIKEWLKNGK